MFLGQIWLDDLDEGFGGAGEGVAGADRVAWWNGDVGGGNADEKSEVVGGGDAGAGEVKSLVVGAVDAFTAD